MYINELKNQYSVKRDDTRLIITLEACFNLNEETLFLINNLPLTGLKDDYLKELKTLGIDEPEKIFEKLVSIQVLKEKVSKPFIKRIGSFLFQPNLHLISAKLQENISNLFGTTALPKNKRFISGILAIAFVGVIISSVFLSAYHFEYTKPNTGTHAVLVFLLILAGIIAHELGHSFMAFYNGIGFRPIGFSVYLFYPIFYTNVSGMENLGINEKLSINLGGIAFQTVFMLCLLGLFIASSNSVFMETFKCLAIILLFNSNPLLKTDAYWCYQDVYGYFKSSSWAKILHIIKKSLSKTPRIMRCYYIFFITI